MNIGIIAGEASGDLLGAGLITALRQQQPDLTATGVGGPAMLKAGFTSLHDIERLSVMGLIEPLLRLPDLLRLRRDLIHYFTQNRPDVFIGIDSPDFNLSVELKLRQAGIPIIHYVSPSVWAWRRRRIYKIAKAVDMILTLLPFEADFYRQHQVPVRFVGHPLADLIPLQPDKLAARKALGIDKDATYIALLPGSRRQELKYMAGLFITTAQQCLQKKTDLKFITSATNVERDREFQACCQRINKNLPIDFFVNRSHEVMAAADAVLVASGTATLEAMLFKRPMVIAYRLAPINYQIGRHLIKVPFIGLPNLLANELLVPEFIQDAAKPEIMRDALFDFLYHPEKVIALEKRFTEIHQQLRCNANQQAAQAVKDLLNENTRKSLDSRHR